MVIEYEIVLATFNGSKYLGRQLDSISRQTIPPKRLIVSDDCSIDNTLDIVKNWAAISSIPVTFLPPLTTRLGSLRNFERLLRSSSCKYVMLCDQDDIWDSDKAELMVNRMLKLEMSHTSSIPLLVHTDLRLIDGFGNIISPSFFSFQRLYCSRNSWLDISLQNVVSGCACLVNRSCVSSSLPFPDDVIIHDWWLALVASRLGFISFIPKTTISYRQHEHNVVGATSFSSLILNRILYLFTHKSPLQSYIGYPLYQLRACSNLFTDYDLKRHAHINHLFSPCLLRRLSAAAFLKLRKHGMLRTIVFYICLCFWRPQLGSLDHHRAF